MRLDTKRLYRSQVLSVSGETLNRLKFDDVGLTYMIKSGVDISQYIFHFGDLIAGQNYYCNVQGGKVLLVAKIFCPK